jgi:glycosyltransferase involved in cell wall biosynthesis
MNILHITRIIGIGGTEKMIDQICKATREEFDHIILCGAKGSGVRKFDGIADRIYTIPDVSELRVKTFLVTMYKLMVIIKKESIDIIHVHHRMSAFYVKLLNTLCRKKVIYSAHTIHNDKLQLTRFTLKKYPIIAVGKMVYKNLVTTFRINPSHITVIPNTVAPYDGVLHENTMLRNYKEQGFFLVGNVGRLAEQKGQSYFIRGAKIILSQKPKTKFFLVGDGPDAESLKQLIEELGLIEAVIMMGSQNHIQSLIKQFDLLVLSSLWEGLPLTPLEAFSVGKAVIASNIDGNNELIKDGINGYLYEATSENGLAEKVIYVMDHKEQWEKLSSNAYHTYAETYSYDIFCRKYIRLYKKLIK